ncbi:hypothetical protein G4G27_20645 [Sphingomonas sp. So64.6b]|uniref:hypothetical protein n=1 Tax=Sphingomonas sp. So64.6b TaxID=2997354 RepID=UPI001602D5F6|nr:hypothetical protein [Sphingomonas sp. So64.6b]QNA86123.1 hypothetical protein G4G27_20645 [Sphingomonas sp. So64.6b]
MKLLIAAAFALASPAMAQTATNGGPASTADQSTKAESERKICRSDARTSTRLSKKTCKTAAEWRKTDGQAGNADDIMRSRDILGVRPNN